jgi:DNA repair exonuclease SbcCD nuclease subunit
MKVIHIGDMHLTNDNPDSFAVLDKFILPKVQEIQPDLIVIPGDIWHKRQMFIRSSPINEGMRRICAFADMAPVLICKGNDEHDPAGSILPLSHLQSKHGIYATEGAKTITVQFRPGKAEFVTRSGAGISDFVDADVLVHLLSYPTKGWFLRDKQSMSNEEANQAVVEGMQQIFRGMGVMSQQFREATGKPVIFAGHLNVFGSKMSNGQDLISKDIVTHPTELQTIFADCYMLNHIHLPQELRTFPNVWYAGSTYHINWGETEKKSFVVVKLLGPGTLSQDRAEIPTIPMAKHEIEYFQEEGNALIDFIVHENDPQYNAEDVKLVSLKNDWEGNHLRVRVHFTREQAQLYTDEALQKAVEEIFPSARSRKIERIIRRDVRSRAANITKVSALRDKVTEYSKSIGRKSVDESILLKADQLENDVFKKE